MNDIVEKLATIIDGIVLLCGAVMLGGLLVGFPVKWLWNWLLPDLFGIKVIGFWQAWGLAVLCGMLFKSSNTKSKE